MTAREYNTRLIAGIVALLNVDVTSPTAREDADRIEESIQQLKREWQEAAAARYRASIGK